MELRYVCSECGHICKVTVEGNQPASDSVTMQCENCHKYTKMRLSKNDDISYETLTRADVNENNVNETIIPDTKNVLSRSSLANLVTLRAAVRTVYGLQEQINKINSDISNLDSEYNRLTQSIASKKSERNKVGHGDDYNNTYGKFKTQFEMPEENLSGKKEELLRINRDEHYESDKKYAQRMVRTIKFLSVLGPVIFVMIMILIILIPLLHGVGSLSTLGFIFLASVVFICVVWVIGFRKLRAKYQYNYVLEKRQEETQKAFLESEEYRNEIEQYKSQYAKEKNQYNDKMAYMLSENFASRRNALDKSINQMDSALANNREKESKALADVAVLKESLKKEIDYLDGIYRGIIHKSDWENLDYIIYVFLTGRADNLKEALHMVDEQRNTSTIVKAIGVAASYLSSNIVSSIDSVKYEISSSASQISAGISSLQSAISLQNLEYKNNIERVVDVNKHICDYSRQSYDMVKEINKSLKDVNKTLYDME